MQNVGMNNFPRALVAHSVGCQRIAETQKEKNERRKKQRVKLTSATQTSVEKAKIRKLHSRNKSSLLMLIIMWDNLICELWFL